MVMTSHTQACVLAFLAGIFLGLAAITPLPIFPAIIGIVCFIQVCRSVGTYKERFLLGALAWGIKSLIALVWFFSAAPESWLPEMTKGEAGLLIFFFWLYVAILLSFAGGLLMMVAGAVRGIILPVVMTVGWVLAEYVSMWVFAFGTYGRGAEPVAGFSFGLVGYALAEHVWLIQAGKWGGVYMLSFLLVAIGYGYWSLLQLSMSRRIGTIVAMSALILLTQQSGYEVTNAAFPSVAIVDTYLSASELRYDEGSLRRREVISGALRSALSTGASFVILPEDARAAQATDAESAYNQVRFLYQDPSTIIVDSSLVKQGINTKLTARVYHGASTTVVTTEKAWLVPNGEYLPMISRFFLKNVLDEEQLSMIDTSLVTTSGLDLQASWPEEIPGVLFCFSSADPFAARRLTEQRRLPFIAHPVSHAYFRESSILTRQLERMLRVQAVWSGVPIIQSANMSEAKGYRPDGGITIPEVYEEGDGWRVTRLGDMR